MPDKSSAYPDERDWEVIPVHIQTTKIMKTVLLCCITFFLIFSCSADSDLEIPVELSNTTDSNVEYPANPKNPYDLKGKKLYEDLSSYYQDNPSPNSVSQLGDQIRFMEDKLYHRGAKTNRLIPFTDEMVESIMSDPDNSMIAIVQNSDLQPYVKNNLIAFLQQLIIKRQQEFSVTYNYITDYEAEVINDTVYSSEESETILTVTSISRYSLYSEEERKDRDWEVIVGGKPAKAFFKVNEVPLISIIALLERII